MKKKSVTARLKALNEKADVINRQLDNANLKDFKKAELNSQLFDVSMELKNVKTDIKNDDSLSDGDVNE